MTNLRLILSSLALLVLLVSGAACGGGATSGATCPTTQTLTYDNFGKAFFMNNCLACHKGSAAPEGYDFSTIDAIRGARGEIDSVAAGGPAKINREMPPQTNGPSDDDRKKLGEWLACGAP